MELIELLKKIPPGFSTVLYQGKKYSLSRTDFNNGKSMKVYAEELGGNDFISFNFYQTSTGDKLKPCEMPSEKVLDFLKAFQL